MLISVTHNSNYSKWIALLLFLVIVMEGIINPVYLVVATVFFAGWRLAEILHSRREQKEEAINSLIAEKTRVLHDRINELDYSRQQLIQKKELNESMTCLVLHDIRSPLNFLSRVSSLLYEQANESGHSLATVALQVKQAAEKLCVFSENNMKWLDANKQDREAVKISCDVTTVLTDVAGLYGSIAASRKNTVNVAVYAGLKIKSDPEILGIIVRNCIDNANKNTTGGTIIISAALHNKELLIEVQDSGKGMGEERVKLVNDTLSGRAPGNEARLGLGFHIIYQMLQKIGGSCSITSEIAKGTTVSICIPAG